MKTNINFCWKFISGFQEDYLKKMPENAQCVDIPHSPVLLDADYFSEEDYQKIYTYEKIFDFDKSKGDIHELVFDGFMLKARIYLNGNDLGTHISGFFPVSIDITSFLKEKENRLLVILDSREDKDIPPFGNVVDYLTFGGIYRKVYILSHPKLYFKRLDILRSDMDGNLILRKEIHSSENENYRILYQIYDREENLVLESDQDETRLAHPNLWSVDSPYLYTLKGTILQEGKEIDSISRTFGFRSFEFRKDGFYLNGIRTKLIGLNRHQSYPEIGIAMPESGQREDADLIKYQCGCNIVRTSHYSQSEDFLEECDRIGLLVQSEVPGWQYVSKDNPVWRNHFLSFIARMAEKEMNHASLISYGIRVDESEDDDELYSKANERIKSIDPYRATTGVRNFKTSHLLEDYYSYNDFSSSSLKHGLDRPSSIKGAKGKPVLITENMGHMYPVKQYDTPERRLEHVLRHLKILNDAYRYKYLGEIGWCAFDYNTHKEFGSNDHICHHGIMDIYRNPKAACFAYQSQNCEEDMMEIINPYQAGDYDECRILPLYVMTNLDEVRLYKNGRFIRSFYPDRKDYPFLKHPPILVDDFIGPSFDEGFSKRQSRIIVKALNYIGRVGAANLNPLKVAHAFLIAISHGKNIQDFNRWYSKYVTCWGSKSSIIEIRGIRNGKEIKSKVIGPSTKFHYQIKASKTELVNQDTYDVSRVSVFLLDEYENQCHYSFRAIHLETKGPIEVLGKKDLVLQGGDISFYVRSLSQAGTATLEIHTDLGKKTIEFHIE